MAQYFEIHPQTPQKRLIYQAAEVVRGGGVIAYPTDSSYALGCHLDDKAAAERIRRIRQVGPEHNFTLVVKDLSEIAQYARVENDQYRMLKALTPGPYTFILPATREVPRRLQHPKRKTIGIRVPDYPIVLALLEELGEPLMSSTLILPGETMPMSDAEVIRERLQHDVDLVIDGGPCGMEPTTVIEWTGDVPRIARQGKADERLEFLQ
jgi:tRNA threonylcarbamoyl adenosine modification protein (Sua5/YciO/YrdC/YwlC family)